MNEQNPVPSIPRPMPFAQPEIPMTADILKAAYHALSLCRKGDGSADDPVRHEFHFTVSEMVVIREAYAMVKAALDERPASPPAPTGEMPPRSPYDDPDESCWLTPREGLAAAEAMMRETPNCPICSQRATAAPSGNGWICRDSNCTMSWFRPRGEQASETPRTDAEIDRLSATEANIREQLLDGLDIDRQKHGDDPIEHLVRKAMNGIYWRDAEISALRLRNQSQAAEGPQMVTAEMVEEARQSWHASITSGSDTSSDFMSRHLNARLQVVATKDLAECRASQKTLADQVQRQHKQIDELAAANASLRGEALRCMVPPVGWTCSRAPGHPGPCAASPAGPTPTDAEIEKYLRRVVSDPNNTAYTFDIGKVRALLRENARLSAEEKGLREDKAVLQADIAELRDQIDDLEHPQAAEGPLALAEEIFRYIDFSTATPDEDIAWIAARLPRRSLTVEQVERMCKEAMVMFYNRERAASLAALLNAALGRPEATEPKRSLTVDVLYESMRTIWGRNFMHDSTPKRAAEKLLPLLNAALGSGETGVDRSLHNLLVEKNHTQADMLGDKDAEITRLRTELGSGETLPLDRAAFYAEIRQHMQSDIVAKDAEIAKLYDAIKTSGYAVLRASNGWSIQDVSEKAKCDEEKTAEVIHENIDLASRLKVADAEVLDLKARCERLAKTNATFAEVHGPEIESRDAEIARLRTELEAFRASWGLPEDARAVKGEPYTLIADFRSGDRRRLSMSNPEEFDLMKAERDQIAGERDRMRMALEPFVDPDAPDEEAMCSGFFWRTIAVTKAQHDAAVATLAPQSPETGKEQQ